MNEATPQPVNKNQRIMRPPRSPLPSQTQNPKLPQQPQVQPKIPRPEINQNKQVVNKPVNEQKTPKTRQVLSYIGEWARERKIVKIRYKKKTTGEVVNRFVEPYSIRYRRNKFGRFVRVFFAWDTQKNAIRGYHLSNLISAQETDHRFSPRFEVEF